MTKYNKKNHPFFLVFFFRNFFVLVTTMAFLSWWMNPTLCWLWLQYKNFHIWFGSTLLCSKTFYSPCGTQTLQNGELKTEPNKKEDVTFIPVSLKDNMGLRIKTPTYEKEACAKLCDSLAHVGGMKFESALKINVGLLVILLLLQDGEYTFPMMIKNTLIDCELILYTFADDLSLQETSFHSDQWLKIT